MNTGQTENRTFKRGDTVQCQNEMMKQCLIKCAIRCGVPIADTTAHLNEPFDEWPNLTLGYLHTICSNSTIRGGDFDDRNWITIEQFIKYCENWIKYTPVHIVISDDYTAVIKKYERIVSIGCQNIPFSKVSEVYHACFPEAAQPIFENE